MTAQDRILPEKVHLAEGGFAGNAQGRQALAEVVPLPVPTVPAPSASPATPLRRTSTSHVFIDMTVSKPVTTEWQVLHPVDTAPILPAPHDTMLDAGEGYKILDADTGTVIALTNIPPSPVEGEK